MHRPVLVTAPAILPVTLEEAKAQLSVTTADDNTLITSLIAAATAHLDGWTGILGRALVEQTWRQDFDRLSRCLWLPLRPVISVGSITWRDTAGQISTISADNYALKVDSGGRAYVRFEDAYDLPGDLYEVGAVSVTYVAGHLNTPAVEADPGPPEVVEVPAQSNVPADIKAAILLIAGHWYANREAVIVGAAQTLPFAADAILGKYHRPI